MNYIYDSYLDKKILHHMGWIGVIIALTIWFGLMVVCVVGIRSGNKKEKKDRDLFMKELFERRRMREAGEHKIFGAPRLPYSKHVKVEQKPYKEEENEKERKEYI